MTKSISDQRNVVMSISNLLNEISGHEEYYNEALKTPDVDEQLLAHWHVRKMNGFAVRYAELLTSLFKMTADKLGYEIRPKPNVVELAEQNA